MRASKNDLPVASEFPGFESRQTQWGEFNVAFETIAGGLDCTEMFAVLPDGRCDCPHWGYVVSGKARIKYADHEDVLTTGDLYYMAPGHIPVIDEDTVLIEFSPLGEYQKTMAAFEDHG